MIDVPDLDFVLIDVMQTINELNHFGEARAKIKEIQYVIR